MSSNLSSFVITFNTYYNNGVTTSISTQPVPLDSSSSEVSMNITTLINTLESQGITLRNNSSIKKSTNSIATELQSGDYSSDIESVAAELPNSTSSASQLTDLLKQLKEMLNNTTMTETSVEEDTDDTKNSSISSVQSSTQKYTSTVPITSSSSKDEEISSLTESLDTTNKSLSKLLTTLKGSVSTMNTSLQKSASDSSSKSASSALSSILGTNPSTTTTTTTSKRRDNFFNNLVQSLLYQPTSQVTSRNRRSRGNTSCPTSTSTTKNTSGLLSQINKLSTDLNSIPQPTVNSPVTNTDSNTSDYYRISTQVSNNTLAVMYSYFPANSTTSSKNITFYLSPKSLISLSNVSHNAAKNLSVTDKSKLTMKSGLGSTDTSDSALWSSYLVCILSFLSRCVASQLYNESPIAPSTISGLSSYNYMLSRNYLESVGNFGLNLQQYGKDADEASFILLATPGKWSDLMYANKMDIPKPGTALYESNSILSII